MSLSELKKEIKKNANPVKAAGLQRFFKTGPGEYGQGDKFLGIMVPVQRLLAKKYIALSLPEIKELLYSDTHEIRLIALLILVEQYKKADDHLREDIFTFYHLHRKKINNWDLVDLTADRISGSYLMDKDKTLLYKLAESNNLWERRIAVMSTFHFIKNKSFGDSLRIALILLNDKHDLIHKAVGWMLREIGNRNINTEEIFLKKHYKKMPRTMLRYAIEKFPEKKRLAYLKGTI
ncbi:MAG: DNA alkylation repair protein [Ignavibacteriaceae bacterium]|nr:DNA alkylation repair protein [Ignavibacteriaceae bacterium]